MTHHISIDSHYNESHPKPIRVNLHHFVQGNTLQIVGDTSFNLTLEEALFLIEQVEASIRHLASGEKKSITKILGKVSQRLEKIEDRIQA
jgi:hypothetical protein